MWCRTRIMAHYTVVCKSGAMECVAAWDVNAAIVAAYLLLSPFPYNFRLDRDTTIV